MKKPTLFAGEAFSHEASGTVGIVIATIYPAKGRHGTLKQVLLLANRKRCKFPLAELYPANPIAAAKLSHLPEAKPSVPASQVKQLRLGI